jgi:mannan endo-1,4-beta-mannosidase
MLPGETNHEAYRANLQAVAAFLKSLRGLAGESIPVIFRPYHEHTGDWFWWGVPFHATIDEFNLLWQWTVRYMHRELNVHNILWVLSPPLDRAETADAYFFSYPGDSYVDIFGMDAYFGSRVTMEDVDQFRRRLQVVVAAANERKKPAALTEVGQENLETTDWFTRVLLDPVKNDPVNRRIVYGVVWRNAGVTHHFAPYPGHPSVPDFLAFFRDPFTVFGGNIPPMYVYPGQDPGSSPGLTIARRPAASVERHGNDGTSEDAGGTTVRRGT